MFTLGLTMGHSVYVTVIILALMGLHAMITHRNLIKKLIGMSIFQSAVILFYVSLSDKKGATIPILTHHAEEHGVEIAQYVNPLPHVLMLTAIVVGVATLGVALSLVQNLYQEFHTTEEEEIIGALMHDD